jgi:hypothetical protein
VWTAIGDVGWSALGDGMSEALRDAGLEGRGRGVEEGSKGCVLFGRELEGGALESFSEAERWSNGEIGRERELEALRLSEDQVVGEAVGL